MNSIIETNGTTSGHHALYIVGQNVTHTIAPPMHDFIATALLSLPGTWSFKAHECDTVAEAVDLFRNHPAAAGEFAGAVVTMPYKKAIMPLLDELDDLCVRIGACNGVYLTPEGKLRGTNTDWRGIKGCLLGASESGSGSGFGRSNITNGSSFTGGKKKPALIIGAGGASRAAVYALGVEMAVSSIYVINRDEGEVRELVADVGRMLPPATAVTAEPGLEIVHVLSVEQARKLESPYYVVGTVPDFEPQTAEERKARDMLEVFFEKGGAKEAKDGGGGGVFLDMCFKPRVTRQIKLARRYGWRTVEGTGIIGHQVEEQWRLWTGRVLTKEQQEEAWKVLRAGAEESRAINF